MKIVGAHPPWSYCVQAGGPATPVRERGDKFRSGMTEAREKQMGRDIANIFMG